MSVYSENMAQHAELAYQVEYAQNRRERYDALQALYRGIWPVVKKLPRHQWAIDPHAINWDRLFSPIEHAMWAEIRYEGAVLYPQHPVGGFFVDFGHPVARVALECDGKRWHMDKEKDAERQRAIESYGWKVYRLTGRDCFRLGHMEYDGDGCEVNEYGPATLLLRQMCRDHKLSPRYALEAA